MEAWLRDTLLPSLANIRAEWVVVILLLLIVGSIVRQVANVAIVMLVLPLLVVLLVLNFVLRCLGKSTLSLDILTKIVPWNSEKEVKNASKFTKGSHQKRGSSAAKQMGEDE